MSSTEIQIKNETSNNEEIDINNNETLPKVPSKYSFMFAII